MVVKRLLPATIVIMLAMTTASAPVVLASVQQSPASGTVLLAGPPGCC
jgi:hypothetical protein